MKKTTTTNRNQGFDISSTIANQVKFLKENKLSYYQAAYEDTKAGYDRILLGDPNYTDRGREQRMDYYLNAIKEIEAYINYIESYS